MAGSWVSCFLGCPRPQMTPDPHDNPVRSEIIVKSTVSVRDLQKTVDDLSKSLRETDTAIQAANWSTDLL